jgi:hypothetical protein
VKIYFAAKLPGVALIGASLGRFARRVVRLVTAKGRGASLADGLSNVRSTVTQVSAQGGRRKVAQLKVRVCRVVCFHVHTMRSYFVFSKSKTKLFRIASLCILVQGLARFIAVKVAHYPVLTNERASSSIFMI